MLFGRSKPFIQDKEGAKVRIAFDPTEHLKAVQFERERLDNGYQKGRAGDMQLVAVIPDYIYGYLLKLNPDMHKCTDWKDHPINKWLNTEGDGFAQACKVAQDHPNRSNFIIK